MHKMCAIHEADTIFTTGRCNTTQRRQIGKGLFAKNVLAVSRSQHTNFFPDGGWRSNVDGVDGVRRQHLRPRTERGRNTVLVRELLCSFNLPAGDGCQFSACGQLYHRHHVICDATGTDDSPTQWPTGLLVRTRRLCGKYGRDRGYNCAGTNYPQELATSGIECRRIVVFVVLTSHTTLPQRNWFLLLLQVSSSTCPTSDSDICPRNVEWSKRGFANFSA